MIATRTHPVVSEADVKFLPKPLSGDLSGLFFKKIIALTQKTRIC
jgi:hypothetical protein